MPLNFNNDRPIYLQLAEALEDDILRDIYEEESQMISTTELAVSLRINPATAGKSVNLLVDEGILYKKRGVGMFVASGAKEKILGKRRENFYQNYILALLAEAEKLHIPVQEIISMIERSTSL